MKNLPLSLALAAASGAFTLQRPADWPPALRRAYILAPGVAIGAISVAAVWKGSQKGRELAAAGTVDLVTPFSAAGTGGTGAAGTGGTSATDPAGTTGPAPEAPSGAAPGSAASDPAAADPAAANPAASNPAPSYLLGSPARRFRPAYALAAIAALTGVVVSGVLALTLVVDERAEAWLVRRGVPRPRRVLAAVAALSSLGLDLALDARDSKTPAPGR